MYDAEHKPAGTCITYAKKSAPTVVSDLITGVRDYASIVTKGNGGNVQFFAGAGTSLYIGIPAKSGGNPIGVIDPKTGNSIAGNKELTDEEKVLMLSQMNKNQNDSLKNILNNTTNPTAKGILKQSIDSTNPLKIDNELQIGLKQYHTARDTFWNGVTRIEDSLIKISDAAITGNTKGFFDWLGDWFKSIFRGPQTSSQMIEKYKNATDPKKYDDIVSTRKSIQNDPEDSYWCGPAAMAWMYYVYSGDPYQYDYFLANSGKYQDGVIARLVWLWTITEIKGRPMSPADMFFSMANITNWDVIIAPWLNLDMNGGSVYQNLQYARKPSVVATFEGGGLHWYNVYGCDRTTYWHGWSDYYFYIYDNGLITTRNGNDITGNGIYLHKKMASYPVASLPVWRD